MLIVCRAIACANWLNEINKFSLYPFPHLVVTSYESLHKVSTSLHFDILVADEAHYVKSPTADRTIEVYGKNGFVHRAKRTFALTGTPTPNHVGELWTHLFVGGITKLSYDEWIERYCTVRVHGYGRAITGSKAAEIPGLRGILKPVLYRRTAKQVNLELPPLFFQEVVVPKGPVKLGYSASFAKYVLDKKNDRTHELIELLAEQYGIIAKITKGVFSDETFELIKLELKSLSSLRRYVGMQKIQPVIDLVSEEIESKAYKKIVLFCHHKEVVEGLRMGLQKYGPVTMYGGTPPEKKDMQMNKFQTRNTTRVMIATIGAAGTSINLTAASQVMFVEQTFVPGDMDQAAKRCHRIGQTEPVRVRFVSVDDGVDVHLARILKRKTEQLSALYDMEPAGILDLVGGGGLADLV